MQTPRANTPVRLGLRQLEKDYDKSENDIKALQSVGQIIGEVLKQLDEEKCTFVWVTTADLGQSLSRRRRDRDTLLAAEIACKGTSSSRAPEWHWT